MTFSGHAAVSVLTLCLTRNVAILIPLNIALHYLLDAIPHAEFTFASKLSWRAFFVFLDVLLISLLLWFARSTLELSPSTVLLTFLASVLPDLIDPLTRKYARPIRRMHVALHSIPLPATDSVDWNQTLTGKTPTSVKIIIQLILIAGTFLLLSLQ